MAAKHTGLELSVFTLDATDYLGRLRNLNVDIAAATEAVEGIADTYGRDQIFGRGTRISAELLEDIASARAGALSVSVLTLDGGNVLAVAQDVNLEVTVPVEDNGGLSDFHDVGQVVDARRVAANGTFRILQSAASDAFLLKAQSSTPADNEFVLSINPGHGGGPITLPVTMGNISHAIPKGGYQEVRINMTSRGAPSAVPASGIMATVFGDCLVSLVADTEAGSYTAADAVITRFGLNIVKKAAQKLSLELMCAGAPGYAASV